MYHNICRNLTVVNDNLSRAQGNVEVGQGLSLYHACLWPDLQKVNMVIRRSDKGLAQLNSSTLLVAESARQFAPTIRMDLVSPGNLTQPPTLLQGRGPV